MFIPQHNLLNVYDLGLCIFKEQVATNPKIQTRMVTLFLEAIEKERNGEVINRQVLKNISQMLVEIGISSREVYETVFENVFLEESAKYYKNESEIFISQNNCSEYLKKAESRLNEEVERVQYYLDLSTEPKIQEVVENELIKNHLSTLLNMEESGEVFMLKNDRYEDLKRMYNLTGRVEKNHESMRAIMYNLIKETGKTIVTAPENQNKEKTYIQSLLDIKDKYDKILQESFDNDRNFQQSMNLAFESFLNMNPRSPEFISLFIDNLLRKGNKDISENEIEKMLEKVMTLFRFIQEKDVFEKYYKQHLAKRLLLNRSRSDDAERLMISKLKTECGYQFTSKLEGMFNDMKLSSDTMDAFRSYVSELPENPMKGIDLSVNILASGNWPNQSSSPCIFPSEIQACIKLFEKFYMRNHSGRVLNWQANMGTADLKAYFTSRRHELSVSTYQMCILLQFNASKRLSFKEIQSATDIPVMDLKRNIIALVKHRIINCINSNINVQQQSSSKNTEEGSSKTTSISASLEALASEDSEYEVNDKFKHKLVKIKITQVVQKETESQRTVTNQKIDNDRKFLIEAAIVRTMKTRKVLDHSNLVIEVTKQLSSRFRPNPVAIKKRIESLIEREYLARSPENRQVYTYLA